MAKETTTPNELTLDEQLAAANQAMNDARKAKVLGDKAAHEAHLKRKLELRRELAAAEKKFDSEILRIEKEKRAADK